MKVIICGSRTVSDLWYVQRALKFSGYAPITEVVSGCAAGADLLGERWAIRHGVRVKRFPADWKAFGRSAGFIRNQQMLDYVGPEGAVVALWEEGSPGTRDMIARADKAFEWGRLAGYYVYRVGEKEG